MYFCWDLFVCLFAELFFSIRFVPARWSPAPPSPVWTSGHSLACLNLLWRYKPFVTYWAHQMEKHKHSSGLLRRVTHSGVLPCLVQCHSPEFHHLDSPFHSAGSSDPTGTLASWPEDKDLTCHWLSWIRCSSVIIKKKKRFCCFIRQYWFVQGVTLPWNYDSWAVGNRLQQTPETQSAGGSRYGKWMELI